MMSEQLNPKVMPIVDKCQRCGKDILFRQIDEDIYTGIAEYYMIYAHPTVEKDGPSHWRICFNKSYKTYGLCQECGEEAIKILANFIKEADH